MTAHQLQGHIDQQPYDKNYQDIEALGFIGYSESYKSWNNIATLNIGWENQSVCDMGCFHAYFGIKVLNEGAKEVIGLDGTPAALETAKLIIEMAGVNMECRQWSGGEDVPSCDIALCLNMLHHCPDQELTLAQMHCDYGLFEINTSQRQLVEKYFEIISETVSHRTNSGDRTKRIILYTQRKRGAVA
jgi:2-polyprenyl-3-methyl-5-hydroxy-6-metoxy-1,4-benzoquinol methylase